MYNNCYNKAIQYLKDTLGTENEVYKMQFVEYSLEHKIHTLLKQYYFGIEPQIELYHLLLENNIIQQK